MLCSWSSAIPHIYYYNPLFRLYEHIHASNNDKNNNRQKEYTQENDLLKPATYAATCPTIWTVETLYYVNHLVRMLQHKWFKISRQYTIFRRKQTSVEINFSKHNLMWNIWLSKSKTKP